MTEGFNGPPLGEKSRSTCAPSEPRSQRPPGHRRRIPAPRTFGWGAWGGAPALPIGAFRGAKPELLARVGFEANINGLDEGHRRASSGKASVSGDDRRQPTSKDGGFGPAFGPEEDMRPPSPLGFRRGRARGGAPGGIWRREVGRCGAASERSSGLAGRPPRWERRRAARPRHGGGQAISLPNASHYPLDDLARWRDTEGGGDGQSKKKGAAMRTAKHGRPMGLFRSANRLELDERGAANVSPAC